MLKKLQWQFTMTAMAAFLAVILVLLCAVNIGFYFVNTRQLDSTLSFLFSVDNIAVPPFPDNSFFFSSLYGRYSPEAQYMIRFFTVYCDPEGKVMNIDKEAIAAVTGAEAETMADAVMEKRGDSGFYNGYRYTKFPTAIGHTIIFLNAERELNLIRSLRSISLVALIVSIAVVFALVAFSSRRAIRPFAQNMEMQKRFITDAGHELKTPLTSITASADILAMDKPDDEWVTNIQAQAGRLAKLVGGLISLSRLDEETPFPEMTVFSLSDAIWEISEPFCTLAQAKGKSYEQSIGEGITMRGDRAAIQQMCSILLDNAILHSDAEGNIQLRVYQGPKSCHIQVQNTCDQPLPENLDRLFERFYRVDRSRSSETGGNGIGLSIARATAHAHGGKLQVKRISENCVQFEAVL